MKRILHRAEMVLPPKIAEALRKLLRTKEKRGET
jgi:hypothetical protein